MSKPDITQILFDARDGDQEAYERLMPLVYDQLREIAHLRLMRHRPGETLDTTALVHEAYLKLIDQAQVEWQDRAHFFAAASRAMRFILVDYARSRTAQKRGGGVADVPIDSVQVAADERAADIMTLNQAVGRLESLDKRLATLVDYRFFGGLQYDEIAELTGRSVPTLKRDWRKARTWLYRYMNDHPITGDE